MKRVLMLVLVGGLVLSFAPVLLPPYHVVLLTKMLIFALLAMSLDILLGYSGLPSLGHAAYFGVGAYTVALVGRAATTNFWLCTAAGLTVAGLLAAGFAVLTLRARGTYYLMTTLALAQVVWGVAFGWRSFTGGDDGLPGIARPALAGSWSTDGERTFYYLVLVVCALATLALTVIVRSPFGKALVGIRESEVRMRVLGYHVWAYQYVASLLGGIFAGLAGVLFVYYNGYVGPAYLSIVVSAQVLLMVLLGGAGTLFGPALGAGIIVLLENVVSAWTERWLLILGLVYIAVTLYAPRGLYGLLSARARKAVP